MVAGGSARARSDELIAKGQAYLDLSLEMQHQARCFAAAAESERSVGDALQALSALGWAVLTDRQWPGSKRANVDFILVGPGGVVIVDVKRWSEPAVVDGALYRGDQRQDDELDKLNRLTEQVAEVLVESGLTIAAVSTVMCFDNHQLARTQLGPITIIGAESLITLVTALPARLDSGAVARISRALDRSCPELPSEPPSHRLMRRRPTPRPKHEPTDVPLFTVKDVADSLLEAALAAPIEDWMTFLHPEQNKLVGAHWEGPARIRGAAGTGKTVVGLHRAVYLAERSPHPILVTSFVKTLPKVLQALAERMSTSGAENIQFIGVHGLAMEVLERVGKRPRIELGRVDRTFMDAWRESGGDKALGQINERHSYWREEIDHVIKGRGLTDFTSYRDLDRVGRKTRLRAEHRELVWDLYISYSELLESRGLLDFNDLLLLATEKVLAYPELFRYSSVIVDEVQDLNLLAFKFLTALAGDGSNSLLIIGDGQQSVYPGGFNLSEAGINVTGRSTVLKVNYRNTREILTVAERHVAGDTFGDLDGETLPGRRESEVPRSGHAPITVRAPRQFDLDIALVEQLMRTRTVLGVSWGDLAVLAERHKDVEHHMSILKRAGIPLIELEKYDGRSTDHVKVGTFKRAKGLDFKYVLLPGLRHDGPERWDGEADDSFAERAERIRREEFVGMTRARDGLWLGYLEKGEWSWAESAASKSAMPTAVANVTERDAWAAQDGTVPELVKLLWEVDVFTTVERFTQTGWSYEDTLVRSCRECAGDLHLLQKPYVSRGREMRYAAVVCPSCRRAMTLEDLGLKSRRDLPAFLMGTI